MREDGQRLFDGCLPTLIQWGDVHPTDNMPESGVTLEAVHWAHPKQDELQAALKVIGATGIAVQIGSAWITATFQTPHGTVKIRS